jgi:hypothetical protein
LWKAGVKHCMGHTLSDRKGHGVCWPVSLVPFTGFCDSSEKMWISD